MQSKMFSLSRGFIFIDSASTKRRKGFMYSFASWLYWVSDTSLLDTKTGNILVPDANACSSLNLPCTFNCTGPNCPYAVPSSSSSEVTATLINAPRSSGPS